MGRILQSGSPASLSDEELALDRVPLTRTPQPVAVVAWVRYPDGPLQVSGRTSAWTTRAVAVEWDTPAGGVHRAWVWASAVERSA